MIEAWWLGVIVRSKTIRTCIEVFGVVILLDVLMPKSEGGSD